MRTFERLRDEARAYYALCDESVTRGIPLSLDDPSNPRTVSTLRKAVAAAK